MISKPIWAAVRNKQKKRKGSGAYIKLPVIPVLLLYTSGSVLKH